MRVRFTMQWLAAWLLSWASSVAFAAGELPRQVDLELTGSVEPASRLLPGTFGVVHLRLRNLGPDHTLVAAAVSNAYVAGGLGEQMILFPIAETAPCTAQFTDFCGRPGQSCLEVAVVHALVIAPSETVECSLGLYVSPNATGRFDLEFRSFDNSLNVVELDPSNNDIVLGLVFLASISVPALDLWGGLLLMLLLVFFCVRRIHANTPTRTKP